MKKNQAIYRDLIRLAQLGDHAAKELAKASREDGDSMAMDMNDMLTMMSYATTEFLAAYLLKRHFDLVKEISDQIIPAGYARFIDQKINEGPPGLKEYLDANMGKLEALLKNDKDNK